MHLKHLNTCTEDPVPQLTTEQTGLNYVLCIKPHLDYGGVLFQDTVREKDLKMNKNEHAWNNLYILANMYNKCQKHDF